MINYILKKQKNMINKIFLLLPILALCACATAKNEKLKEVEKRCEYYNTTNNYYNSKLLEEYKKEKSIYVVLDEKDSSCNTTNCLNIASGKKWNFIEVQLNGDPRNGNSGLYKIHKDFDMYKKFQDISKDRSLKKLPFMSCNEYDNCVSCSSGDFCLVGEKITAVTSTIKVQKKSIQEKMEDYSITLINYNVEINGNAFFEYNTYIYSTKTQYSSFSSSICSNNKNIQPLLIEILGGYRSE